MESGYVEYKFVNPIQLKTGLLRRFSAEKYVVELLIDGKARKICQIIFRKRDGSIFINMPYFSKTNGLISCGTIPNNAIGTKVDFAENGKITTHRIKYSHHPDGEAHFSQDGHVKTIVRKRSTPLKILNHHLFTIIIKGLEDYEEDINRKKKNVFQLKFVIEKLQSSYKIVGRWYDVRHFIDISEIKDIKPKITAMTPDGEISNGFLIGPPKGWPLWDHVLCLTCKEQKMESDRESSMIFIGGFQEERNDFGLYPSLSFLCAMYPAMDIEALRRRIGSIDLE